MRQFFPALVSIALAALLTGCASSTPIIDKARFARPASIAIVQVPPMRHYAHLGAMPDWFAYPRHFSPQYDMYFVTSTPAVSSDGFAANGAVSSEVARAALQGNPAAQSIGASAVGGAVAGMLQAAEEYSASKRTGYDGELRTRMPEFDLRKDVVQLLEAILRQRGVAVSRIDSDFATGPRLRWPAKGYEGFAEVGAADAPAVDADLVLQLSPAMHWYTPGVMHNFRRTGSIGVVIYNGRTKEYLGSQVFGYSSPGSEDEYSFYDSLVSDAAGASSSLREGMLSLVPQIADAVITGPVKPWHQRNQ